MQNVTYEYYKSGFLGNAIPSEADFNRLCLRAGSFIDCVTFGRLDLAAWQEVVDETALKNAVCAVCDALYAQAGREGIKSESNDGYSVTYTDDSCAKNMLLAARQFLPAEVFYKGADEC
jgi:hypothetical protein